MHLIKSKFGDPGAHGREFTPFFFSKESHLVGTVVNLWEY